MKGFASDLIGKFVRIEDSSVLIGSYRLNESPQMKTATLSPSSLYSRSRASGSRRCAGRNLLTAMRAQPEFGPPRLSGIAVPSSTWVAGKVAIRVNITNHRTRRAHLDILLDAVLSASRLRTCLKAAR